MAEAMATDLNAELRLRGQAYGDDPLADRETDLYRGEYVMDFVKKWDQLIDWQARAASEGQFFIDVLRSRGKESVLDVATGTGFHSVRLTEAGFNVTSADGSAAMLSQAFDNGKKRGLILKAVQADWRWLNRDIHGKYDAIICLGNSFTHLHEEKDRRRALAEFYAALRHDGVLILDQRNYDAILDEGFSSKHKYYYCGDQVSAEPEYVDEGLVRMKYSFPDNTDFTLNLCPIRKAYVRRLLSEAGFERVRTYGDFQDAYAETEPDFFIHVAEKSIMTSGFAGNGDAAAGDGAPAARSQTEAYYDSDDADGFYSAIWGGEDLHIGAYDQSSDIREASDRIVDIMAEMTPGLTEGARVLDIGAGYGGSMRRVVKQTGAQATCLNLSETQNDVNRAKTRHAGLVDSIRVVHGVFEDIPEADDSFDVVWSQDALLHSGRREQALDEAFRVLRPGGVFVFTDPMQADDADPKQLQPVYDRLGLISLGSFKFYREAGERIGFETLRQEDRTGDLRRHYASVLEALVANRTKLAGRGISDSYMDRMAEGLQHWVDAADAGRLAWGVQIFRKPA